MESNKKHLKALPVNPQAKANILSRLTLSWTVSIFKKGFIKELGEEDLYSPLEEHRSSHLGDALDRCWKSELEAARKWKRPPSFLRAVIHCFGLNMLMFGFCMVIGEMVVKIAQPLLLAQLLQYFSPNSSMSRAEAVGYAVGVVLCTAGSVAIINPMWLGLLHLVMKLRVACCSIMYRKSLRLSRASLRETTVGQIVNLMSNDVNRFEPTFTFLHFLWIGPTLTIIVSILLWQEVGGAALVGVAALLVSIPAQMWLGKKKSVYRLKTAKKTDNRIRLMSEIINGIAVIKMYTWEKPFEKLVAEARRLEIKEIRGSSYITGVMLSFLIFNNRLAIFCCVVTYVFMGNFITASMVYVVTAYFTIIRQAMSDFFPMGISAAAEVYVTFKRIEKFMLYDEIDGKPKIEENGNINLAFDDYLSGGDKEKNYSDIIEYDNKNNLALNRIVLKNASAKWSEDAVETLSEVNIDFPPGKLTIVIGQVGSGKSSLLQALLRELPLTTGSISVSGKVSYASQEPWLFEASFRQNILFGCSYDVTRYNSVVAACALQPDLQQLSHGDRTLVGDRGVILSGGQRARINLARAVYRDSDIYLLDDPLSAVDSRVGKQMFQQCISGLLRGKTVILVTHQMQYLQAADHIVLLQDGKVNCQGTYQDLKTSSSEFSDLISESKLTEDDQFHDADKTIQGSVSDAEIVTQEDIREEEMRTKGSVSGEVFKAYFTAGGSLASMILMFFMFFLTQFVASAGDYWLNYWVNLEEYVYNGAHNATSNASPDFPFYVSQSWCIAVFTCLIAATIIISLTRSFLFFFLCMRSSMWLHNTMFASITRAVMRFFHTNQSGRILNRFTKDMGTVDELLPMSLLDVLQIGLTIIGIVGILALVNAWLLLPTLVVAFIFYLLRKYYIKTSCGIKRLEGITRSPVFSHLNASLQGLTTIRAMRAESILEREFDDHQDLHSSAYYIFLATTRAFGYWLDIVCFLYIVCVTFSFFLFETSWFGGSVGLAITQTIGLIGMLQWGMKQSADIENFMTSVERILEYTKVQQEPRLESAPDVKPPPEWPTQGRIEFCQVVMAYDSTLPPVLKGLSFTIQPREKVGIVGRTGAGKSSLTSALFRLTSIQGRIIIDNIDITQIGLHDLRSKLSIIPQEPVLFTGNVRKNLDPFDEFPDHILWKALEEVEMKDVIEDLPDGLNSKVSESGSNLSVGQRQLMCLARAVVRNNRILVMDEATANIDLLTDALIQKTIRRKFADCTVLTIAHRLNTIMDSNKVLVMDNGYIVEFDHPHILLNNTHGHFYTMVDQLGKSASESLHRIAALNYNQHISKEL